VDKIGDYMEISIKNLWQTVVDNIKESIPSEAFDLWIAPLNPLSLEDTVFTLGVPNIFFSQWLQEKQKENIEKILSESLQKPISLVFKEQQDLSQITETVVKAPEPSSLPAASRQKDQIDPRYVFETFVVGASNSFAQRSCEAVAKNPGQQFNPLFIYGGVGLGKTHLLHAIGNYVKQNNPSLRALYVTAEQFVSEFINIIRPSGFDDMKTAFKNKYRTLDFLLIDDIQFLTDKEKTQEEFYYVFNTLYSSKKQVVISSDRPPKELTIEERLMSRFLWGNTAEIQAPDLETRIAILRQKAIDEKIFVPDDVLTHIASQIKSNIRELEGSLLRISAFSHFTNTPLTVDSVQKILKDIIKPTDNTRITIDLIQKVTATEFNLDFKDMRSKKRTDAVAFPRQIAMYLARNMTDEFSTTEIGDAFGGRDHTTVMYAVEKIKKKIDSDPYFNAKINEIIKKIRSAEN
jgi:chromosomal replication initiator protein